MSARRRVTQPTQAASPRSLDRWQLAIHHALLDLWVPGKRWKAYRRLAALLKSMERAERR